MYNLSEGDLLPPPKVKWEGTMGKREIIGTTVFLLFLLACNLPASAMPTATRAPAQASEAASPSRQPAPSPAPADGFYDIGTASLIDLYVSPSGSDQNDGLSRAAPLKTIGAAWARIPQGVLSSTGYRLNLLPGEYPCEGNCINFLSGRHGTLAFPIMLQAADGTGTVKLLGGLNILDVSYLYLLDLTLEAGREAGAAFGNNVLHIERGDHVLLRGLTLHGPQTCITDQCSDIQEVLKVNQSQYVYLEQSELSGAFQTVLDFFSVQYGHLLANHIHHSGGRCAYLKGGSAYFQVEGNEFDDCVEAGFQAGEGSNLAFMQAPWLHYEAYDIKVVNNLFQNINGAGLSVSGGYNILMAYNTLYRVGMEDASGRPWALAQFIRGARGCYAADEFGGEKGTQARCQQLLDEGGWGTAALGEDNGGEWIPNRNIYIMNNLFYNPSGASTQFVQFVVNGPLALPGQAGDLPNPSRTDENLIIRGNVIWNKPIAEGGLLGDNNGSGNIGCGDDNPTCNAAELMAENTINVFEPQLVDPAHADFHPTAEANLHAVHAAPIPDFSWSDAPAQPSVPSGTLSNQVTLDYDHRLRAADGIVGAFDGQR
jgi:hypothetical protein